MNLKDNNTVNIDELLINNRVCPNPQIWNKIWERILQESEEEIAKPLILGAWHFTTDNEKKNRFLQHFQKAESLNITEIIMSLLDIPETEWHHINE